MNTSFWKAGHAPTLFAAFLYFDLSFMVWYVLGPLGVQIASDLGLTTQQRAMMVATPILAGAVLRFLMGMLADRTSPKSAGLVGQVIVIAALAVAWLHGVHSYEQALLRQALRQQHFNQRLAAQSLGLSYDQLRGLLRKYGISAHPATDEMSE